MTPRRIGSYEIWEEIARGGMGVVYRGFQPTLGRQVAIKMLLPEIAGDPEFRRRFHNEARAIAQLTQANIVRIHDVAEQDDTYYIIMELIDGPSLRLVLSGAGWLAPPRAAELVRQTAAALGAAHRAGIVHRDIKPENLLLTGAGVLKVMDFGIAKVAGATLRTQAGVRLGTPWYMSPEQAQGQPVDARSDLYALSVVLFELLTGRVPFDGDDPFDVAIRQIREPAPDPRTIRSDLPESLVEIVLQGLAKDPEHRFGEAEELERALEPLAAEGRRTAPAVATASATCPACGAGMQAGFATCPTCGSALLSRCRTCRLEIPVHSSGCPYCWASGGAVGDLPTRIERPSAGPPGGGGREAVLAVERVAGEAVEAGRRLWGRVRQLDLVDRLRGRSPAAPGPAERATLSCARCDARLDPSFFRCPYCGLEQEQER